MAIIRGDNGLLKESALTKVEREKLLDLSERDRSRAKKSRGFNDWSRYIPPSAWGVARTTLEIRCKVRTDNPKVIARLAMIQKELTAICEASQ